MKIKINRENLKWNKKIEEVYVGFRIQKVWLILKHFAGEKNLFFCSLYCV